MRAVNLDAPYRALIYGDPGHGKTVLAAGAKNPCIVMLDSGGEESLYNHEETRHLRPLIPDKWQEIELIAKAAKSGGLENLYKRIYRDWDGAFDTIILDSISRAREMDLREQRGEKDTGDQFIYSKNNTRVMDVIHDLFRSKYNVILICHVKEEKDNEGETVLTRPDLSSGLLSQVAKQVSGIYYLSMRPSASGAKRTLKVLPTSTKLVAKNRYGGLPESIENPKWDQIEEAINIWREKAKQVTEIPTTPTTNITN